MKIPIKYGLLITLGVMAWVLITHSLITNPRSLVHSLGAAFFTNVLQFAMLYLGLKALEHEKGDRPTFKEGLKTGVAISFVYGLTASLFFAGVIAVMGTKWIAIEPSELNAPMSRVILVRFLGLFIGALLFGLVYSTVLSFFLAKRRSEEA
jgi:hypothetical protein